MKITEILPRRFAITYQEHNLRRVDAFLEYYKSMVRVYEKLSLEGHLELERLLEERRK